MKAISNALKGVTYHNPQLGESLYELCRRATSRHISGPDEILNQQVVYMINSEMHTPFAAKDACTCLKRRLQMDHPQKQYLAIILTSKVLQECHAAMGIYQGELLQEVAYILRTVRSSGPAAARTRQVAMDVLRHFGSAGGDAYRVARQQGGFAPAPQTGVVPAQNRDPAAVAAERASLLDEIKRMVEQASASTEILNELILSKRDSQSISEKDDSAGLRKELLADAKELRKLFDLYMNQLAALTGPDAEEAMKAALEAVDQLDNALTLEKDVDAELKDLEAKGQLPAQQPIPMPAAEAAVTTDTVAPTAAKVQSLNLIDLDDEPPAVAATATAAAAAPLDPFAPPPPAAAADPFASMVATVQGPADPFAAIAAAPAAATAANDPFAALAVAPAAPAASSNHIAAGGYPGQMQPFPPLHAPPTSSAAAPDPFADTTPAWGSTPAQTSTPAAASGGSDVNTAAVPVQTSTPQQQQQQQLQPVLPGPAPVTSGPPSAGGASVGSGGGMSAGGYMPQQPQTAGYVMPGMMAPPGYGMAGVYGMPGQVPGYGMNPYAGMTGQMPGTGYYIPQPTGMPGPGNGLYSSPYPAAQPVPQGTGGAGGLYGPAGTPGPTAAYLNMMPQQSSPQSAEQQKPQVQQPMEQPQQQHMPYAQMTPPATAVGAGLSASNPFATVAPAAGSTANPFGAVAAGTTGNVDAEWDKFFKK